MPEERTRRSRGAGWEARATRNARCFRPSSVIEGRKRHEFPGVRGWGESGFRDCSLRRSANWPLRVLARRELVGLGRDTRYMRSDLPSKAPGHPWATQEAHRAGVEGPRLPPASNQMRLTGSETRSESSSILRPTPGWQVSACPRSEHRV